MPDIPIVVLGGGAVGKSCITIQYIQGHFVDKYDATIEDVYRKPVDVDGHPAVLTIVDTAGQDAFGTMREQYMRRGQGFILVYSITDSESFQQLKRIYAQLRRTKGEGQPMACIIVGNKVDLAAHRAVSVDEGRMFAAQAKCPFMEITARNRSQVEDVFTTLVRTVRDKPGAGSGGGASGQGGGGGVDGRSGGSDGRSGGGNGGAGGGVGAGGHNDTRGSGSAAQPAPSQQPQPKTKKRSGCVML